MKSKSKRLYLPILKPILCCVKLQKCSKSHTQHYNEECRDAIRFKTLVNRSKFLLKQKKKHQYGGLGVLRVLDSP